jgi:sugar phosphate isomerase/epimerase
MRSILKIFFSLRLQAIAGLVAGLAATSSAAVWNEQVGLQLESLRSKMGRDVTGTLSEVHDFGFKYVELVGDYNLSSDALKTELLSHQLTAISAHFPYARFRDDPEGIANEAASLGLKFVGCPSLPQKEKLDLEGCQAAIAVFNRAGEISAKHGIQFFYHPHGYEFKPYGDGTFFDLLASKTDPRFVHFQMDVFWIVHAGQDPLKLFEKYGHRWMSMHLKDMKKGVPTGLLDSHADRSAFVPIGEGQIDIPAVVRAAHKVGIKWFFIEDESASPETAIPQSIQYLQKMPW